MLKLRTTKEVSTDLHTTAKHLIEFQFRYNRDNAGMKVMCDAYRVEGEGLSLIQGGGSYRQLSEEQLNAIMEQAVAITPENPNALEYMDSLVASGIKVVIVAEKLWKNQLTLEDFE